MLLKVASLAVAASAMRRPTGRPMRRRLGGWKCPSCTWHNDAIQQRCTRCDGDRDGMLPVDNTAANAFGGMVWPVAGDPFTHFNPFGSPAVFGDVGLPTVAPAGIDF